MIIDMDFLERFLQNIAVFIGENCEIVVHDWSHQIDSTIIKIINGHVSGRQERGCISNLFFEQHKVQPDFRNDLPLYFNSIHGKVIKSCVTFIHNEKGESIGAVALHFDISDLVNAQKTLNHFINSPSKEVIFTQTPEFFVDNVSELLEHYLIEVQNIIGKTAKEMNKEEKLNALAFLNEKGVLQIAKSSLRLCEFFGISKFTLYHYLDMIKQNVVE